MKVFSVLLVSFVFASLLPAQTEFSQENALQILKHLSIEIGPRPMGSPAEQRALQFAVEKFNEYGCDSAYIMNMDYASDANTTSGIAIGIKRGATKRIIVIGGHIDSAGPEIPGADDDGSGSATVIEVARALGKRQMQSTIVFCCFGGEEQGLRGSRHFVNNFNEIDSVAFMLQVDMANGLGVIDLDPDTHIWSAPRWFVSAAVEEFYNLGYDHLRYPTHFFSLNYAGGVGSGSDHESFLDRGIPAIDFSTDVGKPIHTPRDNFENFEPAGLKRSGDLILKLVERFDGGVPTRETERYWLYLIGKTPIFIPIWGLWAFAIVTLAVTIIAFIMVRKRREPPGAPNRIRWSTAKMFLFSPIIVACAWFSSDLIGMIRGMRHPWFTAIDGFIALGGIAMLIGGWFVLQMARKFRLSHCPYVHFKRTLIILTVFSTLLGLYNIKLTVEPAVALLFISLSILARKPAMKIIFFALSPWWMMRMIFSEWSELIFRSTAMLNTSAIGRWVLFNGGVVVTVAVYILPFLFAYAALANDSSAMKSATKIFRSRIALVVLLAMFIGLSIYLLNVPVYNALWYREVRINEQYDMKDHSKEVMLRSSEFLSGLHIYHGGRDTVLNIRSMMAPLIPSDNFDTTWLHVTRQEVKHQFGDTTHYDVELNLRAICRPFTVAIYHSTDGKELRSFDTPFRFHSDGNDKVIEWYSYPDSNLTVLFSFFVIGGDSINERIEVTFDQLAYPMECRQEKSYFIPRTKYVERHTYKR